MAPYDPRVQAVAQAVVRGFIGPEWTSGSWEPREKDSGHQVRRLGEEGLFQLLLEENLEVFQVLPVQANGHHGPPCLQYAEK